MTLFHPRYPTLHAFATGQLDPVRRTRVAEHLSGCGACRAAVAFTRDTRRDAADATAIPLPAGAWERIAERRRAGEHVILPVPPAPPVSVSTSTPTRRMDGRHLRRAAVLLLGVAGVASATRLIPLVRHAMEDRAATKHASPTRPNPTPAPVAIPSATPVSDGDEGMTAGIGVAPADGQVRVAVESAAPAVRIRVRLGDEGVALARGRGAASQATFATGRGRIDVSAVRDGELEIVLPRSARRAFVTVGGRRWVEKDGAGLRVLTPAGRSGAEIVLTGEGASVSPTPNR
jgi:hypothetical protein